MKSYQLFTSKFPSFFSADFCSLFISGFPLGLSYLAGALIVATDILFIGWLGPIDMGAGNLAFVVYALVLQIVIGYLYAVGPEISHALGAKSPEQIFVILKCATIVLVGFFLACIPIFQFSELIFLTLGQPAAVASRAGKFLSGMIFALPFAFFYVLLSEYLMAHGKGNVILVVSISGVVMNAILDWLFIFDGQYNLGLGITGAALSSVLTEACMLGSLLFFAKNFLINDWRLRARELSEKTGEIFNQLLRVGVPLAILEAMLFAFFEQMTIIVGTMGLSALNAHGMFLQVTELIMVVMFGFGEASAMRIAFLIGASNIREKRRAIDAHLRFALLYGMFFGFAIFFGRELIIDFYTNGEESRDIVRGFASEIAVGAALMVFINPIQFMLVSILRAFSDTNYSLVFSAMSFIIFGTGLGSTFVFFWGFGPAGIWFGIDVGIFVLTLLLWRRLQTRYLVKIG